MPTFEVTFVPQVARSPMDVRWTAATERVEATDEEHAVDLAHQAWDRSTPGQSSEPHRVQKIVLIA